MLPSLSSRQRTFLLVEQTIVPALFNVLLHVGLGYLTFPRGLEVAMWGASSLAADTLGTLFLLPAITCLVVTPAVRRAALAGKVERLPASALRRPALRALPRSTWGRALAIGAAAVVVLAPPLVVVATLSAAESLSFFAALVVKAGLAGLLSAAVTPLLAAYALASTQQDPALAPDVAPALDEELEPR